MVIIMLGAPASGKGSVAEILSNEFKIPAISSGDIFRKYISEGTEIGKKANEYMTKGELVPDDITVELITTRLENYLLVLQHLMKFLMKHEFHFILV